MALILSSFLAFVAFSVTHAAVIVPGATWTDTSGNVIQAHGGGILKVRRLRFQNRYLITGCRLGPHSIGMVKTKPTTAHSSKLSRAIL